MCTIGENGMGMHTEQSFCLSRNILIKYSVKVFEVSSRNKKFLDKFNENLRFTKRVTNYHNETLNGNDFTVESYQSIKSDSNNKKERQLEA
jgi:hypothetical protein